MGDSTELQFDFTQYYAFLTESGTLYYFLKEDINLKKNLSSTNLPYYASSDFSVK